MLDGGGELVMYGAGEVWEVTRAPDVTGADGVVNGAAETGAMTVLEDVELEVISVLAWRHV